MVFLISVNADKLTKSPISWLSFKFTRQSAIAFLLLSEFCVFISVDVLMRSYDIYAGAWFDPVMSLINVAYVLIFVIAGSFYFAALSFVIAAAHLMFYIVYGADVPLELYTQAMTLFCVLQLLGLSRGAYHGFARIRHRVHTGRDGNNSNYYRVV